MENIQNIEKLKQEIPTRKIILPSEEVEKLKTKLKEYIIHYYSESPLLAKENINYIDYALDWSIKRTEQYLNPRKSEFTNKIIIGDGSWLGNSEQYFQAMTEGIKTNNEKNKVEIFTIKEFINEYLEQVGIINENQNKYTR